MWVMGMRENLIELIRKADKEDHESQTQDVHYAFMADFLIANGVTIPVRCKECKYCIDTPASYTNIACSKGVNWRAVEPNHFCSYGERRTDE